MRVLVTEPIHEKGIALLREHFEVVEGNTHDWDVIRDLAADCDGILVRTVKICREIISSAPKLKCIAVHGVGVDYVDIVAATERGIPVVNAPFSNSNAVAEYCLGAMLALLRQTASSDREVRTGDYAALRAAIQLGELRGKTVGLIGLGRIAQCIVPLLAPFKVRLLAYDPFAAPETFEKNNAERCETITDLLSIADIVTIHVPLTKATRDLISAETIKIMKPGSYIINAARGGIVNEEAVVDAIESGRLAGAAFDVFVTEPPQKDSPLLRCDKIILSPHSAALTAEARRNMAVQAAENLIAVLKGQQPTSCVNKDALGR
ncbi:hydroxyacid dehydrogenase [Desulfovibrio sp. OttesenSCG-928-O18]|nr:hydroxyacid dehydrogenase [Desulfovibrio sp. OttesenSCG-928-O18]